MYIVYTKHKIGTITRGEQNNVNVHWFTFKLSFYSIMAYQGYHFLRSRISDIREKSSNRTNNSFQHLSKFLLLKYQPILAFQVSTHSCFLNVNQFQLFTCQPILVFKMSTNSSFLGVNPFLFFKYQTILAFYVSTHSCF